MSHSTSPIIPISPAFSGQSPQPRLGLQHFVNWLLGSPLPQPDDIRDELVHQRTSKTKTLLVAVFASLLMASIAAALTGANWAYAWVVAELVLGGTRISILYIFSKAKAAGRKARTNAPIWAGLASIILISAGCYQCVASGILPLIMMAGIGLANLIGGISSRNSGTPRYGILLICILTVPFALATLLSPIQFLFLVGLQTPLYTAGMIFLLLENHKILLDLHRSEHTNRQMAHYDLLTGLPNRAMNLKLFSELLAAPAAKPAFICSKLTVFCLDLDGFKGVNDRLGHATGDAVLVAVASRLRASVRDTDFVCRLGGDEFVILLPNIMPGEIETVARRIITQVSEPFEFAPTARVGVSIGIASVPHDGVSADELLSAADRAMYEAKRRGKGGFAFYASIAETVTLAPSADAHAGPVAALSPDLADSVALAR
jgi:diguanylate cyclase (GGDEF)-like protein